MIFSVSGLSGAAASNPSAGGGSPPAWQTVGAISADSNATGATASVSGSPSANDILFAHVSIANSSISVITAPAGEGWALVDRSDDTAGTDCTCAVYWKRWGSGSTDNTSIAFTGTAGNMRLVITRINGAIASGTPFSAGEKANANGGGAGTGTTLTAPAVTSDGANRLVLRFYTASSSASNLSATGDTTRYSGASYAWSAGVDGQCAGSTTTAGAGSTGTSTATCSSTLSNGWAAVTVAIDPV